MDVKTTICAYWERELLMDVGEKSFSNYVTSKTVVIILFISTWKKQNLSIYPKNKCPSYKVVRSTPYYVCFRETFYCINKRWLYSEGTSILWH